MYHTCRTVPIVCMVTHIARVWINRVWLSILLAVSLTGEIIFSLSPFAPEKLVWIRRVRQSRPASAHSFSTLRLNHHLMLTHGIPPAFRDGVIVHSFIPPTAIGSVPSLSGHTITYRRRSLPRVPLHRPSTPQVNSSTGWSSQDAVHMAEWDLPRGFYEFSPEILTRDLDRSCKEDHFCTFFFFFS